MQRYKNELGNRLTDLRKTAGYTQSEVARRLGINASVYSGWETSRTRPRDLETLSDLANLYHCRVDYLIGRTDEKSSLGNDQPFGGTVFMHAMQTERAAKELIASYVVENLIKPRDLLMLDVGSTLTLFAMELRKAEIPGLIVASHSISIPAQLMGSAIQFIQLGGVLHIREAAVLPEIEMPQDWCPLHGPYKAIMTAEGFSTKNGAATRDLTIAHLDQRYMSDADEVIMLLDNTKFSVQAAATSTMAGIEPEKTEWLSQRKKLTLITNADWGDEGEADEYRKLAGKIEPKIPEDRKFSSIRIFESELIPKSEEGD